MSDEDRERWNRKYLDRQAPLRAESEWLTSLDRELPTAGTALDVAGGSGRHAIWMARRGLSTTLADVSDVALEQARAHAREAGVTLCAQRVDLESEPLPRGPWDLIVNVDFLSRPLLYEYANCLNPSGFLVFVQPTMQNLERHAHPSARFLLEPGELARGLRGLEVLRYDEAWRADGRHAAWLLARRPAQSSSS